MTGVERIDEIKTPEYSDFYDVEPGEEGKKCGKTIAGIRTRDVVRGELADVSRDDSDPVFEDIDTFKHNQNHERADF